MLDNFVSKEKTPSDWNDENGNIMKAVSVSMRENSQTSIWHRFSKKIADMELISDLSQNIGSAKWFRGLITFILLLSISIFLMPSFGPLYGAQQPMPSKSEFEQARGQMIVPLALGADTGIRMATTDSVIKLKDNPERPRIELTATLGQGDSFTRVLRRAGVSLSDAKNVRQLVANATPISEIKPGTPIEIILGRRSQRNSTRPLESLSFRARFDLDLAVVRDADTLAIKRQDIAVDNTPLRIKGKAGKSLYRSARAAGIEASKAQQFLKVISQKLALSKIRSNDEFDVIIEHKRAATGEVETGGLLYAGIDRGGSPKVQMLKWKQGQSSQWFEASGVGESKGRLSRPVPGRITSNFGRRRHPVLGYVRMHNGIDFKARYGTPIRAATDGRVTYSGRNGGAGKFVKIKHGGGISTGYAHMSRIAVSKGKYVRRGQIIGYVGSTGLSTGPHLHYILYRNGKPVNPRSVTFTRRAELSGKELSRFKSKLTTLKSVKPGAALAPLQSETIEKVPTREIEKLSNSSEINVKTSTVFPFKNKDTLNNKKTPS